MKKFRKSQSGFTLIELLVVMIIVAVLAAVGIPLLRGNVERARLTEADSFLGTIRTALRATVAEKGTFPTSDMTDIPAGGIGITAGDLTGRWFEDDDFSYDFRAAVVDDPGTPENEAADATYCIRTTGDTAAGPSQATTAPRGSQVNGITRSMDEDGDIFSTNNCTGSAVNA